MTSRDLKVPPRAMDCCTAFDEFMRRKPKRLRNTYWKAFAEAWRLALETEIQL